MSAPTLFRTLGVAALFLGVTATAPAARQLPLYSTLRAPTLTGSAGPDDSSSFSATLPNGRRLTPTGQSVVAGMNPLGSVLTPDGRYLIVSNDDERGGSCAAPPCPTFSGTTQNGAGATPPAYTLSVVATNRGGGTPVVARVAFGAGSGPNPAVAAQPNGHPQIAESGQNESPAGSGTPATPDKGLRSLWLGLALKPLSATSAEVYAAGGPNNAVGAYRLDWSAPNNVTFTLDATTSLEAAIPTSNDDANKGEAAPGGLVLDETSLWVVNNNANSVQRLDVSNPSAPTELGGPIPIGFFPYAGAISGGRLLVTNWGVAARTTNAHWRATGGAATGFGEGTLGVGGGLTPAASLFANPASDPDRSSSVSVIDPGTGAVTGSIPLGRTIDGRRIVGGTHPSAIVSGPGSIAYVADTNEDAIAVIDGAAGSLVGKVSLPPPGDLPNLGTYGLQPNALAFDGASHRLYVAEAGLNSVAVLDTSHARKPSFLGRFPTGWYPTALSLTDDGRTLYVTNAKGVGNFFGFAGQNSGQTPFPGGGGHPPQAESPQDDNFTFGSVERVDVADVNLTTSTAQVTANTFTTSSRHREEPLRKARAHIKHVFFILKENKSYDSYLGADSVLNARGADGYAPYAIWDAQVPNVKKLAEEFNVGDNFYADSEESNAGHQFALTGQSTDYQQKTLLSRFQRPIVNVKNEDPEDYPLTGYIFNNVARNGVSFRDYGDNLRISGYDDGKAFDPCLDDPAQNSAGPTGACSKTAYDPSDTTSPTFGFGGRYATTVPALSVLAGNIDTNYPGWNLRITDQRRAREFAKDMGARIAARRVPEFTFIWLPQDHTGGIGLTPGTNCGGGCANVNPAFQVKDGDAATGQIVDYISHSPIWKSSAIFITEDDTQATADHVYAHRTFATVASPWAKRGTVIHTFASTVSMTKTIEELLGVPPMSYGDELATDLADYFTKRPDFRPFTVAPGTPRLAQFQGGHGAERVGAGKLTPGRVRVVGKPIRPHRPPSEARRIFRLMDQLSSGLDEYADAATRARLSELYMDSVHLATRTTHKGTTYRRAQARLYRQALAVLRGAAEGENDG